MADLYEKLENLASEKKYYQVPVSKSITWDLSKNPHSIISGASGFGKSFFLDYLIMYGGIRKWDIYLCDPKNSDLAGYADFMDSSRVANNRKDIVDLVEKISEIIPKRMDEITKYRQENRVGQVDFADVGMNIVLLVVDEVGALTAMLSGKDKETKALKERYDSAIAQITMMGRQAGVDLIMALQQPRADSIPTNVRSQSSFNVYLGNATNTEYRMIFGDDQDFPETTNFVRGQGFYKLTNGMQNPDVFETPFYNNSELYDTKEKIFKYLQKKPE